MFGRGAGDLFVNGLSFGFGVASNVHNVGGFEGPNKRLNPRHRREEADITHHLYGFGVGMLAGNGDPPRQPRQPYQGD